MRIQVEAQTHPNRELPRVWLMTGGSGSMRLAKIFLPRDAIIDRKKDFI
jgi:hypothetical protein